jgi:hypothetical protein
MLIELTSEDITHLIGSMKYLIDTFVIVDSTDLQSLFDKPKNQITQEDIRFCFRILGELY